MGYVRILDEKQALEFIRLFTGLETHYLFDNNELIEVFPSLHQPSWGELSKEEFRRLGLQKPTVSKSDTAFVIVRFLADTGGKIYRVEERVYPNGKYKIESRELVAQDVGILIPLYE
jgi:hypothetical protein